MVDRIFTIVIEDETECVKCDQLCSAPHSRQIFQNYTPNNGACGLIAMYDPIFGHPHPTQNIVLCQNPKSPLTDAVCLNVEQNLLVRP